MRNVKQCFPKIFDHFHLVREPHAEIHSLLNVIAKGAKCNASTKACHLLKTKIKLPIVLMLRAQNVTYSSKQLIIKIEKIIFLCTSISVYLTM